MQKILKNILKTKKEIFEIFLEENKIKNKLIENKDFEGIKIFYLSHPEHLGINALKKISNIFSKENYEEFTKIVLENPKKFKNFYTELNQSFEIHMSHNYILNKFEKGLNQVELWIISDDVNKIKKLYGENTLEKLHSGKPYNIAQIVDDLNIKIFNVFFEYLEKQKLFNKYKKKYEEPQRKLFLDQICNPEIQSIIFNQSNENEIIKIKDMINYFQKEKIKFENTANKKFKI